MLLVRCTDKLLRGIKKKPALEPTPSTTRLGDWYATIVVLRPSHLVLLVNARTRLPVLLRARELSTLARRIPAAIADVLRELGAPADFAAAEVAAMDQIVFAKTEDRSVLGTMNEYVLELRSFPPGGSHAELLVTAIRLGRIPTSSLHWEAPNDVAKLALGIATDQASRFVPRRLAPAAPRPVARIYELKITLRDVGPAVWRRVQLFSIVSLKDLHRILQGVMGWENCHMHEFEAKGRSYGVADPEFPTWVDQRSARLDGLLRAPGDGLVYKYDFGDGWKHDVILERMLDVEPGTRYPRVVGGARACPPEDCGGPYGYEHLLAVLANARHPEHRDLKEWVGGSFDAEAFDAGAINRALRAGSREPVGGARRGG